MRKLISFRDGSLPSLGCSLPWDFSWPSMELWGAQIGPLEWCFMSKVSSPHFLISALKCHALTYIELLRVMLHFELFHKFAKNIDIETVRAKKKLGDEQIYR